MVARYEKGLCFYYDAKFMPGHKCSPPQFLCIIVDVTEESLMESTPSSTDDSLVVPLEDAHLLTSNESGDPAPYISFHALTG